MHLTQTIFWQKMIHEASKKSWLYTIPGVYAIPRSWKRKVRWKQISKMKRLSTIHARERWEEEEERKESYRHQVLQTTAIDRRAYVYTDGILDSFCTYSKYKFHKIPRSCTWGRWLFPWFSSCKETSDQRYHFLSKRIGAYWRRLHKASEFSAGHFKIV